MNLYYVLLNKTFIDMNLDKNQIFFYKDNNKFLLHQKYFKGICAKIHLGEICFCGCVWYGRQRERRVAPFQHSHSKHFNIISMHDVLLRRTWESILQSDMTSQNGYFGILLHLLSQEAKPTTRSNYRDLQNINTAVTMDI